MGLLGLGLGLLWLELGLGLRIDDRGTALVPQIKITLLRTELRDGQMSAIVIFGGRGRRSAGVKYVLHSWRLEQFCDSVASGDGTCWQTETQRSAQPERQSSVHVCISHRAQTNYTAVGDRCRRGARNHG